MALRSSVRAPTSRRELPRLFNKPLDAVVERLLLVNRVVEHLAKAAEGAQVVRVFKNARFLNTC